MLITDYIPDKWFNVLYEKVNKIGPRVIHLFKYWMMLHTEEFGATRTRKVVNSTTGTLGNLVQGPQATPSLRFLVYEKAKVWRQSLTPCKSRNVLDETRNTIQGWTRETWGRAWLSPPRTVLSTPWGDPSPPRRAPPGKSWTTLRDQKGFPQAEERRKE